MKKIILLICVCIVGFYVYSQYSVEPEPITPVKPKTNAERLHDAIVLFADSFNIPLHVAFNMAYLETTYRGPLDSTYDHRKTSRCGAVGAMQIMPKYASYHAGFPVTKQELRDSIELNVYISMKIMASNYAKTKSWTKSAGKYHTGKACVDTYAKKAVVKDYQSKWVNI
jgi:hypothetical protein